MLLTIFILAVGLVLMSKGADFFVDGASSLAKKFKIPSIIIGLTIVAMGTSAPEASVSITSAIKGVSGVAIGNAIGSNIANILLILGITSAICALKLQRNTVKFELPFVTIITVLLCGMGYYFQSISRVCAAILLTLFILFLGYLFKMSKDANNEESEIKDLGIFKIILFIVGGLIALVYGSDLTVNSAIDIAKSLNISDRIIGLTIIAIGTSLPELVTCIIAALKKQSDIAIGNIVGSNIFNILFVIGLTGVIKPMTFSPEFLFDGAIAIISSILLFMCTVRDRALTRWEGISFIAMYIGYLTYIIVK